MPGLQISSVRAGEDGLVNQVFIVNEDLVFRFAKTEAGHAALEREARLLDRARPHLSLRVPELVQRTPACVVYRFIPGVPLSRQDLMRLDRPNRSAVLAQVGTFLQELHGIDLPDGGPVWDARRGAERLFEELERELLPHMMAWARTWAREHFRPVLNGSLDLGHAPAFIHGDITPYHLCYDSRAHRLVGVIDFGDAGSGDPALDIGSLINGFGETLLRDIQPAYRRLDELIDRARFYAGTLELRWGLAAIRSRDPAWFLCHLGYARDVQPVGQSPG